MSFRQKLLALFAATVFVCVAVVSLSIWSTLRRSFEEANQERASAIAAQFRSEFQHRAEELVHRVEAIASSESVQRTATDLNRAPGEPGSYVTEARALANQQNLDFLELVDAQGAIISSAQWQAKFGYPEPALPAAANSPAAFLKREELAGGSTLGMFAARSVHIGEQPLYVIGGERLDQRFLSTMDIPTGTRVLLYQNLDAAWNPKSLLDLNGPAAGADRIAPLVEQVRRSGQEFHGVIHWSDEPADAETFSAIPLTGANQQVLGVLLVGSSRRPLIELQRQVVSTALLVGGIGILIAVVTSLWFAARVTRPVASLAEASRRVALGDLSAKVDVQSGDELGELASTFNQMTADLLTQKERTVQAERVAAWRELARRLAHELKNPLFPLQVTVENLVRAKEKAPEMFEEVFRESTSTLLAEINNLKAIIARFSEFSKMPQPQRKPTQVNDVVNSVLRVFHAQLQGNSKIATRLQLAEDLPEISADPELLHRALSNLVLNAIDAMPEGGVVIVATRRVEEGIAISISDTGAGLTEEECQRLFTPYYTTKKHGTGLGLAIVQSVVSDHGGRISVESTKQKGTTFRIELPYSAGHTSQAAGQT